VQQTDQTGGEEGELPAFNFKRALHTIYLNQINPKFPGDGSMFCAPTSTTMEFSYLVKQGFTRLLPPDDNRHASYIDLIETLGSADFMDTTGRNGTRTLSLIQGVQKYVQSKGYVVKAINYSGVNGGKLKPPINVISHALPDFEQLRIAVNKRHSIVLMNVGYYRQDDQTVYHRSSGHWLAVVGYGTAGDGNVDPSIVLLHNPADRPPHISADASLIDRLAPTITRVWQIKEDAIDLAGNLRRGMYRIEGAALRPRRDGKVTLVEAILSMNIGEAN
jgi:hypothetical protein